MALLPDVVAALRVAIAAMAPPTYNYTHPQPDITDPAAWVYPQSFLSLPQARVQDKPGVVGKHQLIWPLTIRTLVGKGAGPILVEVEKVLDDMMSLMHAQAASLQALGLLRYELASVTWSSRLVAAAPAESRIVFDLWIRQSRKNPGAT